MANAKLYRINTPALELKPKFVAGLKGQVKVVFDELMSNNEPRLAKNIAAEVEKSGKLSTKQDIYRVVLYYILILKKKGFVTANEVVDEVEVEFDDEQLQLEF